MESHPLAREVGNNLIITLLPIDEDAIIPEEMAIIEFVSEWFWAGFSLPEYCDAMEKLDYPRERWARALRSIRRKNRLQCSSQIPFLKLNGVREKSITLLDPASKHRITSRQDMIAAERSLKESERRVVLEIKKCFSKTLLVPSPYELSQIMGQVPGTTKNLCTEVLRRFGLEHVYQIPFVFLA
ncbi:MAG TPA: hypothetical protein VGR71_10510 [Nitrospira sp.]|nr:hypothetical protein [Nitrospira sp.]